MKDSQRKAIHARYRVATNKHIFKTNSETSALTNYNIKKNDPKRYGKVRLYKDEEIWNGNATNKQDLPDLVKKLDNHGQYTRDDIFAVGRVWNRMTTDERKKVIINTHNGFTDGHYANLGKRFLDLDQHTQGYITGHWNKAQKPFDKDKASFHGVTPN